MRILASKRLGHAVRRRGIVAAGMAAVVGIFVVATAVPAFAHFTVVSGQTVCSDGEHVITWSLGNSEHNLTMHITEITARLGADTFATTGYTDVPGDGTTSATTVIPGGSTGTVTLYVNATWPDGATAFDTGTVTLISGCSPGTTSTTMATTTTAAPTTTTQAPTTTVEATTTTIAATTTTEGPTTTTTIPSSTTTATTPISTQGSTVQTTTTTAKTGTLGSTSPSTTAPVGVTVAATPTTSTGALPFTGSSDSGPMLGLSSLVVGALALALSRRRHRTTE